MKMKKEVVQEFFIEAPLRDGQGNIVSAPLAALFMVEGIKRQWHTQNLGEGKTTLVSMGPAERDGKRGYAIRKEIVSYKV